MDFNDVANGAPSVTFGANHDLVQGEMNFYVYYSPKTLPAGQTPFRIAESFSAGHMTSYSAVAQDGSKAGVTASFNPATGASSVSLSTIASATPLTLNGVGAIDALIKLPAASVISNDGAGIVSHDGGGFSLIGQDGGGLVAVGGGNWSVVSNSGAIADIISHDGGGIVSHDGGGIVSHDGGGLLDLLNVSSLIGQDGGGLVATNVGSLVAAGGGNLIAAGGGNLIAAGGGNLIAAGGGNLIAAGGGNLIAAGGGNLSQLTGAQLLASDATRLIGQDGAGLLSGGGFTTVATTRFAAPVDPASTTMNAYALLWSPPGSTPDGGASAGSGATTSLAVDAADAASAVALAGSNTAGLGAYVFSAAASVLDLLAHFSSGASSLKALLDAATAPPDLKVTASYLDRASADAGGDLTVAWQVQNAGAGAAGASTSNVVLSTNAVIGDGDDVVIGSLSDPSLGAGKAVTDTLNVKLPSTLTPGVYYIGVVANGTGALAEDGTNNFSRPMRISVPSAGTALAPDLTVTAAFLDKVNATAGSVVNVSYQIKNAGTAASGVSHSQIYLHAQDGSTPDVLLSTLIDPSLPAGNAVSDTVNVTLPANLKAGTYYLTVVADGLNEVAEAHEANNASNPMVVAVTVPTRPEILFASDHLTNYQSTDGVQLWSTDGGDGGAQLFKKLTPGYATTGPAEMAPLGDGRYLMSAPIGGSGQYGLWITDGTVAGTVVIRSGLEAGGTLPLAPVQITPLGGGRAVFIGQDAASGVELWSTDGTAAGTQLLKDIAPGAASSRVGGLTAVGGGKAVFTATDGVGSGTEVWVTDGSAAGTRKVVTAPLPGAPPQLLASLGEGRAVFSLYDGTTTHLYVTDGTATGTTAIYDRPVGAPAADQLSDWGNFVGVGGGYALFQGTTTASGRELWVTDGTRAGTHLLADLNPGQGDLNGLAFGYSSSPQSILSLGGGKAFVAAWDVPGSGSFSTGSYARQLFYVDAAAGAARLVTHIGPDEARTSSGVGTGLYVQSGQPLGASLGDGRIVFSADDGAHGYELWVSDGTATGTRMVKDLNTAAYTGPGSSSSAISNFQAAGLGKVLFTASPGGGSATYLWITDGTAAGTHQVNDYPYAGSPVGDVAVFNLPVTPAASGTHTPTLIAGAASNGLVEAGGGGPGVATATVRLAAAESDGSAAPGFVTTGLQALGGGVYAVTGTYGVYTLDTASGVVTFTLNNQAAATKALAAGAVVTDSHVFQVTDGAATASATASFSITGSGAGLPPTPVVSPPVTVNTAPVLGGGAPTVSTALPNAVVLQPGLTITDPDAGAAVSSARVAIVGGFVAGDRLTVTPPAGVAVTYDSTNGVLTLAGSASDAAYQAALRSVTFSHDGAGVAGVRTLVTTVSDDLGAGSNAVTEIVNASVYTVPATTPTSPPALPPSAQAGYAVQTPNLLRMATGDAASADPSSPLYAQSQAAAAIAAKLDAGQLSAADAQSALFHLVDGTTSVAEISYAFFTGRTPTAAGLTYLVHSSSNANDLNDSYYQGFTTENRYINFAANLATGGGAGAQAFQANYGSLSLSDATAKAYAAVFGITASADKISAILNAQVSDGRGGLETRAQYLADITGGSSLAQKAAVVGFLLADSVKEGFGLYQQADQHFLQDLAHGTAAYNVDLLAAYTAAPTLVGQTAADPMLGG